MPETQYTLDPVLVVGGCGGLGSHIVNQLLDEGHASQVYIFDINTNGPLHHPRAKYIRGNLTSREEVTDVIDEIKPKLTFHTASPKLMGFDGVRLFDDVNVNGTKYLLDALRIVQPSTIRALIYTSSASVIHNSVTDLVDAVEDLPYCLEPEQQEHYSHTKAVAEIMIKEANREEGLVTCAIRACTLFGEGDNTFTAPTVLNARAGRAKFQIGNGRNLVDFTYIGNTAHAHILAARALIQEAARGKDVTPPNGKVNGETFTITNDEPWPFWEMSRTVAKFAGHPVKSEDVWIIPAALYYVVMVVLEWSVWISSMGKRESHFNRRMVRYLTMTRTFDISKAKKRLGYRPRVGMEDGIERAVTWFTEHNSEANQ